MLEQQEKYWQAVVERDASMDGLFVMGVKSTGIYCKPSCPARKPRRDRVVFFAAPVEAEAAGFRACLRCRPSSTIPAQPDEQDLLVERARRYIEDHLNDDTPLTLAAIGAHAGASQYHLQRVFTKVMGVSPRRYAETLRLQRLKDGLRAGDDVTGAMYAAGYGSSSRLYESAAAALGMTPGNYRKGGEGVSITYTIVDCSLGRLLVAGTGRGVCAVALSMDDAQLERHVREEYPAAHIARDDEGLAQWATEVRAHVDRRQQEMNLPVDVQGTPFQLRVWQELRAIPYGETRTYSEVARSIGRPSAARAVARACATNRVALLIPCHRVVREDGSLGGYRWGLDCKRALLDGERAVGSRQREALA
jgi:AraC family transcriptional regulator of adaptative response/methylated-DNA-[protein]-cysteine methyltransferase